MESDGGREAIRPATAEEAAVKRNTDCVYFLASPLTCKKGNECEYRHSEGARVNPRDCWYWLNGNCLNPKCSFRHPPLDSLFAMPMPNSGAVPPSQAAASTQSPASRAPNNNSKQNVPCYYFQWGQCLKGDWCPFIHGTQASLSSVSQQVAKASPSLAEAPQISKKDSQQNSTVQQNVSELNLHKPKANLKNHIGSSTAIAKLGTKAENLLNHEFSENKVLPPYSLNEEPPSLLRNITSNNSGCSQSKSWGHHVQPSDEQPENGRDTDEFVHEYSPGFDVLVEDDIKDPDYYRNEDSFRRVSYHGGQNLEPEDDYDYHHSDYEHIARLERDRCNGVGNYDNYEQARGRYGWESKITDRPLDKPSLPKRRLPDRETGPNDIDGSDLRHRLKQRRGNGSKSTSNRDGRGEHSRRNEHYAEERHYSHHSRDERQFPRERSLSTRLQGRITLPGRSSTDTASNSLMEKERGRRSRGRVSPSRQMNYLARHPEGIRQQASEEFNEDGRMGRNKSTRRDGMNSLDFSGPKSLAELKGSKIDDRSNEQSIKGDGFNANLNKVKSGKVEGFQESENSLSFKGPMPLSVILKKKRESAHADRELSADPYDNNSGGESAINESVPAAVSSLQSVPLPETGEQGNDSVAGHEQEYVTLAEDGELLRSNGQSPTKAGTIGTREGTDLENADEEELDNYNQRDGDFDYESGEYKADDDETAFRADEDDLEDEDDFATKVSVMLS